MTKSLCAQWLCLGVLATTTAGCPAERVLEERGAAAGSAAPSDTLPAAGSGAAGSNAYDNPVVLLPQPDAGTQDAGESIGPSCGASRVTAEQIVVDTEIEVPIEVSEEVPVEVTEEVTEQVSVDVVTKKPVVLYLMLDQSLSMASGLWAPAVKAVKTFVNADSSAELGVALQYFPSSGTCSNGSGYSTPSVAVGTLPAAAAAIEKSLGQHSPTGIGTPVEGALRGATEFCKTYQKAHADEQCVAVLITDGKPELSLGCEESSDKLAKIASDARTAGVTTFAVGLSGADFGLLDKIAKAGGAPDCDTTIASYACNVSSNTDKLSDALAKIRETVVKTETHTEVREVTHTVTRTVTHTEVHTEIVKQTQSLPLPCEWAIPDASADFDANKVNIRLTHGDQQTTYKRVDTKAACIPDAWFYDDPSHPSRFIACDQTCADIKAADEAKIDILLGCATITPG